MARNVEIKARLKDFRVQANLAQEFCTEGPTTILQEDIFFHCNNGRLKLRVFQDGTGQLIFYTRPDQSGPKTSEYFLSPTNDPSSLRVALTRAYGEQAVVIKKRLLFITGRTRIHLDDVENLGEFLELEVVLENGEDESVGRLEANELMKRLKVQPEDLIESAYVDLLAANNKN